MPMAKGPVARFEPRKQQLPPAASGRGQPIGNSTALANAGERAVEFAVPELSSVAADVARAGPPVPFNAPRSLAPHEGAGATVFLAPQLTWLHS